MAPVTPTPKSSAVFDVWLAKDQWAGTTLSYSFPTDGAYYSYNSNANITPLSPSQQTAVRKALGEIAGFTGLAFYETPDNNFAQGDLRFAADLSIGGGYAYLPATHEQGGDAFFGRKTTDPQIGNEPYLYFSHEIGHTLGLKHGHDYKSFRNSGMDSQEFTVMTYTDYIGDTRSSYDAGPVDWAQSFMLLDIAALQFLYGANYAPSGQVWSGDTFYSFSPATGEMAINGVGQGVPAGNRIFRAIWDGDGNDTYDLSNYGTDLTVDLAPGGWSVFSQDQLADLNRRNPSPEFDARGNLANALLVDADPRALIENAIGGSGDDTISGNGAANRLQGNGGKDNLNGLGGADLLLGNGGRDRLKGGNGADTLDGGGGRDKLIGGLGGDLLTGGNGNDRLIASRGADILFGDAGKDMLRGGKGADVLTGGAGADTFRFFTAADSVPGGQSDIITDFTSGSDRIDLTRLAVGPLPLSLDGVFDGMGPGVITQTNNGDTWVLVDTTGDASANFRLILQATETVVASDFLL